MQFCDRGVCSYLVTNQAVLRPPHSCARKNVAGITLPANAHTHARLLLLLKTSYQFPFSGYQRRRRVVLTWYLYSHGHVVFIHFSINCCWCYCREHFAPLSRATLIYNFVVFFSSRVGDYANIVFTTPCPKVFIQYLLCNHTHCCSEGSSFSSFSKPSSF